MSNVQNFYERLYSRRILGANDPRESMVPIENVRMEEMSDNFKTLRKDRTVAEMLLCIGKRIPNILRNNEAIIRFKNG